MQDLHLKEVQADWVHPRKITAPGYRILGRPRIGGKRYYLIQDSDESLHMVPGATTITKSVLPTPRELQKWMANYPGGWDAAQAYMEERADYGSTMHALLGEASINGFETEEALDTMIELVLNDYGRQHMFGQWAGDLKANVLSWLQFLRDYEVICYAVEIPLWSRERGFANQVDFIVEKNKFLYTDKTPKKDRRREVAVIDCKSGGIYQEHPAQLGLNLLTIQENFPQIKVNGLYNWSPRKWRKLESDPEKGRGYQLKNQSKHITMRKIDAILTLWEESNPKIPNVREFNGPFMPGYNPEEMYAEVDGIEYFKKKELEARGRDDLIETDTEAPGEDRSLPERPLLPQYGKDEGDSCFYFNLMGRKVEGVVLEDLGENIKVGLVIGGEETYTIIRREKVNQTEPVTA